MIKDCGKLIAGFEDYGIREDGVVRNNWNGYELKPDKSGCVCIHRANKRKTLSIARLVAIYWLNMPDDKKHRAFKKDPTGGFEATNIGWDTIANLNKERLEEARKCNWKLNNYTTEEDD